MNGDAARRRRADVLFLLTLIIFLILWVLILSAYVRQNKTMNRLSSEHSAYLKSAAHQPIHWFPWSAEPFEKAQRENKPILLDIGAVWCHWCHVMDMESYENKGIAQIINDQYVAIKVDRDERPDVDARYQTAVGAISGQGGWPLTAFLMPDGRLFYGGTYFPPDDRYGRPGFAKVLLALSETFQKEHEKVLENADRLSTFLAGQLSRTESSDEPGGHLLEAALNGISRSLDARHGGFGGAPKFPHPSAIEFLLASYDRTREAWMLDAVRSTLRAMAQGGIHDHLGGGFHRYSTDERWLVPHFEKMLYDNAPLLVNYVHAYQATSDPFFRDVASGIVRFVNHVLFDPTHGGFFASQDADVTFGDDGSYFTWTVGDAQKALSKEEFEVLQTFFDIYDHGEMQHDPSQNVLFIAKSKEDVASLLRRTPGEVERLLSSGKQRLLGAREQRQAPFVDRTIYANWNGMMISAYFEFSKAFGNKEILQKTLRSLDRILSEHMREDGLVSHRSVGIAKEAFLDDQIQIAQALLDAFEVTGNAPYLAKAEEIMLRAFQAFWDESSGGFNDVPKTQRAVGTLNLPFKSIQDSPTAAPNSVAALVMNRLFAVTEKPIFKDHAQKILRHFAGTVKEYGVFGAAYFLALETFLNPPPHVVIISNQTDKVGLAMHERALATYRYAKIVSKVDPALNPSIPSIVRGMMADALQPVAYVCTSFSCAPPVYDPENLEQTIRDFGRNE